MSEKIDIKKIKADVKAKRKSEKRAGRSKVWSTAKHYVICVILLVSVVGLIQLGMFIQRQNDGDVNTKVVVRETEIVKLIQAVQSKLK